jgi:hypothetical protein
MAQLTASTALANSTSAPSPMSLTTRPAGAAIVGSISTLVLETHFETADGAATFVDYMPLGGRHCIVRLVVGTSGKVAMGTELILRFGYGAIVPWVTRLEDGALRAIAEPDMVVLRTPVHLRGADLTTGVIFQ